MMWTNGIDWHFWEPLLLLGMMGLFLAGIRQRLSDIDLTLTRLVEGHLNDHQPFDLGADDWLPRRANRR